MRNSQTCNFKLFAALKEDAHQGWIWLKDPKLPARSIVKMTNPAKGKTTYCEALQIDHNFLNDYNQPGRNTINKPESAIVIGAWYRAALGGLSTKEDVSLIIKPCNWLWGRFMACVSHPQAIVRVASWLGLISVLLGFIGCVFGVLSFCGG